MVYKYSGIYCFYGCDANIYLVSVSRLSMLCTFLPKLKWMDWKVRHGMVIGLPSSLRIEEIFHSKQMLDFYTNHVFVWHILIRRISEYFWWRNCELKWSGGWSTGTVGWLSASERGHDLEGWPAMNTKCLVPLPFLPDLILWSSENRSHGSPVLVPPETQ